MDLASSMANIPGWNIAAVLRAAFGCFFEVAFFWQLVRRTSSLLLTRPLTPIGAWFVLLHLLVCCWGMFGLLGVES